jgi:hypothetical protein
MNATEHAQEAVKEHLAAGTLVKVAPAGAVVGADFMGVPLPDLVYALTAVYLLLQIGYLVWKWHKEARGRGGRRG